MESLVSVNLICQLKIVLCFVFVIEVVAGMIIGHIFRPTFNFLAKVS